MPSPAPLLTHRWVLRTSKISHSEVTRYADIASDTLANIVVSSLFNFFWQKRIGDRGARRPNHIEYFPADKSCHGVWRGEPAHAYDRLCRDRLYAHHKGFM